MCESRVVLWAAAVGTGLGVSSTFPAALTLPPEYGVNPTARLVMGLQFAASAGEMSLPFVMGIFFQWERCSAAHESPAPFSYLDPTLVPPRPSQGSRPSAASSSARKWCP